MLISILRASRAARTRRPAPPRRASRSTAIELNGPLPDGPPRARPAQPRADEDFPYLEPQFVRTSQGRTRWLWEAGGITDSAGDADRLERERPRANPSHAAVIASARRSSTFDRDLDRVLAIFAN